jgi:hypothetical protein
MEKSVQLIAVAVRNGRHTAAERLVYRWGDLRQRWCSATLTVLGLAIDCKMKFTAGHGEVSRY